jgi:hypothetical protein
VKFETTLAQNIFSIAMIVFAAMIVFIFSSTAVARTPSVEVVEAGVLDPDAVGRTPSLDMAGPLEAGILNRTPSLDMGFYPIDWDPDRKSLLWNAFPQPLQDEIFEKTPSLQMAAPLDEEIVRKTPSLEMAVPLDDEIVRKTPSLEMAVPLDEEIVRKTPSLQLAQPLEGEIVYKNPSQAVREPLNIECCGPTMRFNMKEAASAEIAIYSVNGRLVRRLTETIPGGESSLTWDGRDDRGSRAASGVYFARVQANTDTGKGKLVLIH